MIKTKANKSTGITDAERIERAIALVQGVVKSLRQLADVIDARHVKVDEIRLYASPQTAWDDCWERSLSNINECTNSLWVQGFIFFDQKVHIELLDALEEARWALADPYIAPLNRRKPDDEGDYIRSVYARPGQSEKIRNAAAKICLAADIPLKEDRSAPQNVELANSGNVVPSVSAKRLGRLKKGESESRRNDMLNTIARFPDLSNDLNGLANRYDVNEKTIRRWMKDAASKIAALAANAVEDADERLDREMSNVANRRK